MSAILFELLEESPSIKIEISLANLIEAVEHASKLTYMRAEKEKQEKAEAETLVTRTETAKMLGVTTMTLNRWSKIGYLIPQKIGSKVYYRMLDINAIKGKEQAL